MKAFINHVCACVIKPASFWVMILYLFYMLLLETVHFSNLSIVKLFLFFVISIFYCYEAGRKVVKAVYILSMFILAYMVLYININISCTAVALWLFLVSGYTKRQDKWMLTHFASAILMCIIVEIFLLRNVHFISYVTDLSHGYSKLIRNAFGRGRILGPELLNIRFYIFSIISVIPFFKRPNLVDILMLLFSQLLFILIGIMFHCLGYPMIGVLIVFFASLIIIILNNGVCGTVIKKHGPVREGIYCAARAISILYLVSFLIYCGSYCYHRKADLPSSSRRILFINDNIGGEGSSSDITNYKKPSSNITINEFQDMLNDARYDSLVYKVLPALGYTVDIKTVSELKGSDINNSDLIVALCLQNVLDRQVKKELLSNIYNGKNLMVFGDHTNILNVQKPFNDLLKELGIFLNYDSVYPFGKWYKQMVFCQHPIHLNKWLQKTRFDIGFSVGASLEIDNMVVRPIIMSSDGFSDEGTPDAPQVAGLGDSAYTNNEIRGGNVLVAERDYGAGKIMAFGDTAMIQNLSVASNFGYIDSLFDYMTMPTKWRWYSSQWYYWFGLVCSIFIVIMFLLKFSFKYSIVYICAMVIPCLLAGHVNQDINTIKKMTSKVILIDNAHGENIHSHSQDKGISTVINFLNVVSEKPILITDSLKVLNCQTVDGLLLLAPRGVISNRESNDIEKFISKGGRVFYASGYYESIFCHKWLKQLGCEILPIPLGAGQDINLKSKKYEHSPQVVETWKLNLSDEWNSVIECFKAPILAERRYGKGYIAVLSDSYCMYDDCLKNEYNISPQNYIFYNHLLEDIFGKD